MASTPILDRREFLKKSAVGGTGLIIGFYLPGKYEALAGTPPKDPYGNQRMGANRARR